LTYQPLVFDDTTPKTRCLFLQHFFFFYWVLIFLSLYRTISSMHRTVALFILDGFGFGKNESSNPIVAAHPETLLSLMRDYPTTSLQASGIEVGLPWGETGNSEVGHLTIGAGRVIYQHLPRITMSIQDESFFHNQALTSALAHAKSNNSRIHFVGLLTDTPVHASLDHLTALIKAADTAGVSFWLHLFTDGKDSPPGSVQSLLTRVPSEKIASLSGRYYGMDRTTNWSLTQSTYEVLTGSAPQTSNTPDEVISANKQKNPSEEFLPPCLLRSEGAVTDGDAVFFFNFREDSMRQISESFLDPSFSHFPKKDFSHSLFCTMTSYKSEYTCPVAFPPEPITNCLGEVLSAAQKTQLRVTESYKYAHVTYFFNGLRETPFPNEYRVLIPSLQTPRTFEHPELRAREIGDRVIEAVTGHAFDFVLANFPNGDMIGHTGNYDASVAAVTILDREIARVIKAIEGTDTILCITSDHGNVECVSDPLTGRPDTSHDPNPVPFILVAPELRGHTFSISENLSIDTAGSLADIAPTILDIMRIAKPTEMNGSSLLKLLR
jgi:2,3-bisphosphoglycerate-independent phosphoglycerate mutase